MPRSERPLVGCRVLLTRPRGAAGSLVQRLRGLGARVEARPTITLAPPADPSRARRAVSRLERYDWLLFTSANGVRFFFSILEQVRGEAGERRPARVAALGPATARQLAGRGWEPALTAAGGGSEEFAVALRRELRPGQSVLLVRPESARPVLGEELRAMGVELDAVVFYRNVVAPGTDAIGRDVRAGRYDVVVFTSPSTLHRLLESGPPSAGTVEEGLQRTRNVAIGGVTAKALRDAGLPVAAVAEEPSDEGIAASVLRAARTA